MIMIDFVVLGICLIYILIISVQPSKGDAQQAFSGEKSELFANKKERGSELFLTRFTAIMSILFFVSVFLASYFRDLFVF